MEKVLEELMNAANGVLDEQMSYYHDSREVPPSLVALALAIFHAEQVLRNGGGGICPKCRTQFKRPEHVPKGHPGFFCPECKRMGFTMLGIVHFPSDVNMNIQPEEITTA